MAAAKLLDTTERIIGYKVKKTIFGATVLEADTISLYSSVCFL